LEVYVSFLNHQALLHSGKVCEKIVEMSTRHCICVAFLVCGGQARGRDVTSTDLRVDLRARGDGKFGARAIVETAGADGDRALSLRANARE